MAHRLIQRMGLQASADTALLTDGAAVFAARPKTKFKTYIFSEVVGQVPLLKRVHSDAPTDVLELSKRNRLLTWLSAK
jgi:hypothetical protein